MGLHLIYLQYPGFDPVLDDLLPKKSPLIIAKWTSVAFAVVEMCVMVFQFLFSMKSFVYQETGIISLYKEVATEPKRGEKISSVEGGGRKSGSVSYLGSMAWSDEGKLEHRSYFP
ncbi:hypothetical protein GIB67_032004 [Kingdonia uniflora]|uniref:Uncharacterized protein n=1 Tax=Kingdonia uniflora TaxID=39325 RepID=A0A7J7MWH7_9MAGN|nr:hypothetical protein GIB67_032004 [Kingdonia uniflora]